MSTDYPTAGGVPASNDPDDIRAEIERTRARLSDDVDDLGETANPKNIARRQGEKVKDAAGGLKEKVMGSSSDSGLGVGQKGQDAGRAVSGAASDAADSVGRAPAKAKAKAQGSPLTAGLIAFGAGLLIAGLIPSSQREQQAVADLGEHAEPLKGKAREAAQELGEQLREPAQEAAQAMKESAAESVQTVKGEGQSAAQDVQGQAQASKETVQDSRQG